MDPEFLFDNSPSSNNSMYSENNILEDQDQSKEDMEIELNNNNLKFYQIFRRFFRLYDDYFFVDSITLTNSLDDSLKFLENEIDQSQYKWIHKDTFIIEIQLNKIYDGFQNNKPLYKKEFYK